MGVENSCFQFNPYNPTKTLSIGKVSNYYSGLNLFFDISDNMLYGTSMYRGVVIYITPYGDDHRYLSLSKSIDLKGGETTIIKITEKEVSLPFLIIFVGFLFFLYLIVRLSLPLTVNRTLYRN